MNLRSASWIAFVSAFVASGLALRVAVKLGLAAHIDARSSLAELEGQSRMAAASAIAALVSVIAQIIEKASK